MTFEELNESVNQAIATNDTEALLRCASQLDMLNTPRADALAANSRGIADLARGSYPSALQHFYQAVELHESLGNRSALAGALCNIGLVHWYVGDYTAALDHYHRALALCEELGIKKRFASNITGNIGLVYMSTDNYPAALEYFHRALAMYQNLGDQSGVASALSNLGNVQGKTNNYPAALKHFHDALDIQDTLGERSGVANNIGNIGTVHSETDNYDLALEHFNRALTIYAELGERNGVARITGNIGGVHNKTGNYPLALEFYQRALALHREMGERSHVASATVNIIGVLTASGQHAEAESYLHTMDTMEIDNKTTLVLAERNRALILDSLGKTMEATATLQSALVIAREHTLAKQQADIHKSLRDLALRNTDLVAYVEHNNEYTRITEEINGKDTATKLAMLVKQREIDAKELEHQKHMAVLHSTLPKHIADRVVRGEVVNDSFDNAAVLFLDVVGFTTHTSALGADVVVQLLQDIFTTFDGICARHNVMKIKTIGDSYMAVAFGTASVMPSEVEAQRTVNVMPSEVEAQRTVNSEQRIAEVALAMIASIFSWPHTGERVQFRIGLHCGPVVAGVLGTERMQYDVWGDTVNVASRMESTSEPGRIHISSSFALAVKGEMAKGRNGNTMTLHERGSMEIKGKGKMKTYWLE